MNAAVTQAEREALLAPLHDTGYDPYNPFDRADAVDTDGADEEFSEDRALADLDTFTDWLTAPCMHQHEVTSHHIHHQVRMPGEPFDLGEYQLALDAASVPQLLHVTLESLDAERVFLAVRELKARYIKDSISSWVKHS